MSLRLRHPPARRPAASAEAESWFLQRGLPSVLTWRGRWRRLWSRSAPMLAAYATIQACGLPIFLLTGRHEVTIDGERAMTTAEWILLGVIIAAIPLAVTAGWLVSRLPQQRIRAVAATIVAAVAVVAGVIDAGPGQLREIAVVVAVVLILTGCGVGSVVGWAVRMVLSHLASVGALAVRALPVMLLTALVFFNAYVWIMSTTIGGDRLALTIVFLIGIATAFVVSATIERVRPMLQAAALPTDCEKLADTPFAEIPDTSPSPPLTRTERFNVVFIMATSQLVQILVVAAITATIYLILGLIVLTPALLQEWTHTSVSVAKLRGTTLPVPDSLIHMCLILGALTFMYVSARAVDGEYRSRFLDPLLDDLHSTLTARNRYRAAIATSPDGQLTPLT